MAMIKDGTLLPGMQQRIERAMSGERLPGHYPLGGAPVGLWKQVADAKKADGTNYEIAGLGGSWFRYAGNFQWSWQRDFFDVGNAGATFMAMIKDGTLLPGMQQRMERAMSGERLPGHYRLGEAPVGLWEVPPGA